MGRRGVPESVTSDNAATFKAGEKVLLDLAAKRSENGEVLSFMANNGICWHYITPHSPWKGAFYERLIQMVKHAFYKAVGRRILSREELETLLVEIEGVLNSRPLTYQGTDMEEEMVIRPIDFIQRGILLDLELGMTKEDDEEYLPPFERNSIRTKIQAIASIKSTWDIAESFWTTWSTKYLLNLKDTFALKQGRTTNRAPRIGELVFIVEEDLPRNAWLMGRIVTVIPGTTDKSGRFP
ncbi:hypothetical protein L596_026597 [Steinernema carpocapsae]|uniref:Integrase catalytic domain-containing protein n=1 Tax=Steinernema carpocapsae TaxID=34508 RepID=A0A4U5M1U4_STECR|nr:hypothetical protein L596_026597 [Steinernema carpocapsae]